MIWEAHGKIAATDKYNFVQIAMRTPLYGDSDLISSLLESKVASRLTSSPSSGELPLISQSEFDCNSMQVSISDEGKALV